MESSGGHVDNLRIQGHFPQFWNFRLEENSDKGQVMEAEKKFVSLIVENVELRRLHKEKCLQDCYKIYMLSSMNIRLNKLYVWL